MKYGTYDHLGNMSKRAQEIREFIDAQIAEEEEKGTLTDHMVENVEEAHKILNVADAVIREYNGNDPGTPTSHALIAITSLFIKDPELCDGFCEAVVKSATKLLMKMVLAKMKGETRQ